MRFKKEDSMLAESAPSLSSNRLLHLTSLSESVETEISMSRMQKIKFVSSRVFVGLALGVPKGMLKGYILGYGVGYGINRLLETLPEYSDNPDLPLIVAEVGLYTGAALQSVNILISSGLHSLNTKLSWREYLVKVLSYT